MYNYIMKKKNQVNVLNLSMLFVGFAAFEIFWFIFWTFIIGVQFASGISGKESFLNNTWGGVLSDLGYFIPIPLTAIFLYFFTKKSIKKTLLFILISCFALLIIFSFLGFAQSFFTHLNYAMFGIKR